MANLRAPYYWSSRICSKKVKADTGKEVYLTYYLIAAHPRCYENHMKELVEFCHDRLKTIPEQVQTFTPTPSTVSAMMYHVAGIGRIRSTSKRNTPCR
ncbi:MAG: hypothetical protein SPJ57_02210 [Candidatus Methanomethylophilaceae archaeon]|nr:hypothetical protein [Candidatus Methanomethylophilaceae archaeon]